VLCDRNISLWLKKKFYQTAIISALLYDMECWAIKSYQPKDEYSKYMLRWMCGKMRRDKVKSEDILTKIGIAPIEEKMRENHLRWFGHVRCKPTNTQI